MREVVTLLIGVPDVGGRAAAFFSELIKYGGLYPQIYRYSRLHRHDLLCSHYIFLPLSDVESVLDGGALGV